MQVISSNSDGSVHLVREDDTLEDSASDSHGGGEGALVVDVSSLDGGSWGLETESDLLEESGSSVLLAGLLGVHEHALLLLESSFSLDVCHVCFLKV